MTNTSQQSATGEKISAVHIGLYTGYSWHG